MLRLDGMEGGMGIARRLWLHRQAERHDFARLCAFTRDKCVEHFSLRSDYVVRMHHLTASIVRVLVAIAMGFSFATAMPAGDCGATVSNRRCECCKDPASLSCCAAQENRAPEPQPAAPASRALLENQPAALLHRMVIAVLPPVTQVIFPPASITQRAGAGGHSFQSVRCIRMV
jgi:hypothetical protein